MKMSGLPELWLIGRLREGTYVYTYYNIFYHSVSVSPLAHFSIPVVLVMCMHFHTAYVYILEVHMLHAINVLKHVIVFGTYIQLRPS